MMSDSDDDEGRSFSSYEEDEENLDQDLIKEALDLLLDEKKEEAFSLIIKKFNNNKEHKHHLVDKEFSTTLLHQCLLSIKKGSKKESSSKEIVLASRAIALSSLTVGFGEHAREIYEHSIHPLNESLVSGLDKSSSPSLVRCLAIITFLGANDLEETKKSMDIMWQLINPKLGCNNVVSVVKVSPSLITTVVSSWSFLLSTLSGNLELNPESWKSSVTYLSSLLDKQDRSVRIVAGKALALIFEIGLIDENYAPKVIHQVQNLAAEAGGKGCDKKDFKAQRKLFQDITGFFCNGFCPEIRTKIGHDSLYTSSWSQMTSLNFFKHFFGGGFNKHMQENEMLQRLFDFMPSRGNQLEKNKFKSNYKARTRSLNKLRDKRQNFLLVD